VLTTDDVRQQKYWQRDHGFRRYDDPTVQLFVRQRIEYMRKWLDLGACTRVLDVGCGSGAATVAIGSCVPKVWGADRSIHMLETHPLYHSGTLAAAEILSLPFRENSFDLVYAWEVLHHVSEPEHALIEMARVSRKYVLAAEPNRANPAQFAFALLDREHRWVLRTGLRGMARQFENVGLRVVASARGGYIFPNKTPASLARMLAYLPYQSPFGISNWVVGVKA
jgi:ubiquinone/menaquinone biosynthesis C-methylase UbiE